MYKLGLKPPRLGSIQMRFGAYFDVDKLPAIPTKFGRPWKVRNWGMLGNDREGNCYWAGACHESMILRADVGDNLPMFTTRTALDDYHKATGGDDVGTDLQEGCAWRQKNGIHDQLGGIHKIDVYTALRPGDLRQLELAVFYLGIAGVGVRLPETAEEQFNMYEPWTVEPRVNIKGGHYIPAIGRNSLGDWLFVTWGRVQAATPEWVEEYMDQGAAMVSRERLNQAGVSPQGLDLAKLTDDYHELTGA